MATVDIGCPCVGRPHPDGDRVELYDPLPFKKALAMEKAVGLFVNEQPAPPEAEEILAELTEAYIVYGVESWTLVGPDGEPLPVSRASIMEYLLGDLDRAHVIADAADTLYQPVVMRPLLERASRSSPSTPTDDSTSARTGSAIERPMPSKQSSTTTSPTADIEPTPLSRAGASSSSRKSA